MAGAEPLPLCLDGTRRLDAAGTEAPTSAPYIISQSVIFFKVDNNGELYSCKRCNSVNANSLIVSLICSTASIYSYTVYTVYR